jgi:hypothetical protein
MNCGLYHDPPPSELPGHGSALAGALYGALAKLNFGDQLQVILYCKKYRGIALCRQASFAFFVIVE